ncbi:GNAT family N-acetyltransferase [Acetobacterium bakii]|uniref:Acetyltransferase n=1 Tax=Acetobacterium bakii TaxID=52689 RepID=A0A0L6TYA0_9FIRM|nr:GNAT family N-acetyltransferase [Acetobacterium bakii]KNZ40540.1 acetyltransferase [Acetobacterium bakii]
MKIRSYQSNDCNEIIQLFYNTVHSVNIKDYSETQLDAWATGTVDIIAWDKSLTENYAVICEGNGVIIGFGDLDHTGHLDKLYVHKDYQRMGIATAIADDLENYAIRNKLLIITTHASITAKSFFKKRGYLVLEKQQVKCGEQLLTNFVMAKYLKKT